MSVSLVSGFAITSNNIGISIESLCPRWTSVLNMEKWQQMRRYHKELIVEDLTKPEAGPVGEAYGWTGTYFDRREPTHCEECAYLSWSFRYIINGPDLSLDEELVTIKKQALVEHWENIHSGHKHYNKRKES